MTDALDDIRLKHFPVLDDGHVVLIDVMGDDAAVVHAARVSYGAGTRAVSDDRALIRYLMRNRHTTPFEMCELKFRVRVPMDCWRQWVRHRTASVNEYSTRYSEAIDSCQKTAPDGWRPQSAANRQGSGEGVIGWPSREIADDCADDFGEGVTPGGYLSTRESALHSLSRAVYEERLAAGVAREQARKDLPLSTYTEAYWKIDLHNLFHFLGLRMDPHAQQEIRSYADVIAREIVAPLFPLCWDAFEEYRLSAVTFGRTELKALAVLIADAPRGADWDTKLAGWFPGTRNREREEFVAKIDRIRGAS